MTASDHDLTGSCTASNGKLPENVMHFARILRGAGVPVGPDKVIDAVHALEITGIGRRDDFYWTLASLFVDRREHLVLFDQAFHIFWRDPQHLARMMQLLLPKAAGPGSTASKCALSARLAGALLQHPAELPRSSPGRRIDADAALTFSDREVLQTMDFETMTSSELTAAGALIEHMQLPLRTVPTRRFSKDSRGTCIDPRATLRAALRASGALIPLQRRAPIERLPPLVVLCDISGSMSRYTRMFLHFVHALINRRGRVQALTFGTRLTYITRCLSQRDVDAALADVSRAVKDWAGGTRIGACLGEFNKRWSRRLLAQGATVLLMSDGLDRDAGENVAREMERLHKSCRRLIWLNPLLRYAGFDPRSAGIKAMLPHVDAFLPVYNVENLGQLANALSNPETAARSFH